MENINIDNFVNHYINTIKNTSQNDLVLRSKQLAELNNICNKLQEAQSQLSRFVEDESFSLMECIKNVENNLFHVKKQIETPPGFEKTEEYQQKTWADVAIKVLETQQPTKLVKREIADGVFIDTYTIKTPDECHNFKGWWCYHVKNNRFYLSINNLYIEAITTNITPPEVTPYKCIEHRNVKYGNGHIDWQTSKFYIPRTFDESSNDIRQFTARMKFVPASRDLKENEPYTYRIGSRDTLPNDIKHLEKSDFNLFNDLVGNYLLSFTAAAMNF